MIRTNKDLVMCMFCIFWLLGSFATKIFLGDWGLLFFQQFSLIGFGIMVLFKINHKKFGEWLEKNIK